MNVERNERLYHERGYVPVRFRRLEIREVEFNQIEIRAKFCHPCPCRGWKLDTDFYGLQRFDKDVFDSMRIKLEPMRLFKQTIRAEALNHVREFFRNGTIDGKPY